MTHNYQSVDINDDVQDAVNIIVEKGFLTVPILEEGEIKGAFTVFDAIWAVNMEEAQV